MGVDEIGARLDAEWSTEMVAAQSGDRAAYERLLGGCAPLIRRVVRRQGVHTDSVDDVMQEILLTVHRARQTYDPSRSFSAWLCTIARRHAIDNLRRRGRQDRHEVFSVSHESHANPIADARHDEPARAGDQSVTDALDRALKQREAIEAIAHRQLSLDETPTLTRKVEGALKVGMYRALKALRSRFGG